MHVQMDWKDGVVVRTSSVPQPSLDEFEFKDDDGMIGNDEQEVEGGTAGEVYGVGEEE